MMHRTKFLAATLAALMTAAAAVGLLAGSATAAQWHVYEGDVHAGHAYGLDVPAGASSYEIAFEGEPGGSALLAVFGPAGEKLGHHALSSETTTAAFIQPEAGRHVLYVYEVEQGALQVRVNAEAAPALALQELELAREDVPLVEGDGAPLQKAMSLTLRSTPVFMTLLYEGSVESLDATIASQAGNVVTIQDETGTAFSPGVFSKLTGTRDSEPANLQGLAYKLTLDADAFEGRMLLTTVSIDLAQPVPPQPPAPDAPDAPEVPAAAAEAPEVPTSVLLVEEGVAMEFAATAGKIELLDAEMLEEAAEASEAEEDEHHHADRHHRQRASLMVSIYTPSDELLAVVQWSGRAGDETPVVELPEDGAYVAYVHHATSGAAAIRAPEGAVTDARALDLVTEEFTLAVDSWSGPAVFELENAPVALLLMQSEHSFSALSWADLESERGTVATLSSTAHAPYFDVGGEWTEIFPENFAAGEHALHASSFTPMELHVVSVSYLRVVAEDVAVEKPAADESEEASDEKPSEEGWIPRIPGLPLPPW